MTPLLRTSRALLSRSHGAAVPGIRPLSGAVASLGTNELMGISNQDALTHPRPSPCHYVSRLSIIITAILQISIILRPHYIAWFMR